MGRGQPAPYRSADTHTPPPGKEGSWGGGWSSGETPVTPPHPPATVVGTTPRSRAPTGGQVLVGLREMGWGGQSPAVSGSAAQTVTFFFTYFVTSEGNPSQQTRCSVLHNFV